jgi:hypothetical protein
MTTSNDPGNSQDQHKRVPDDQRAPNVRPRETHQTSEVPLGSGDRPEAPGSGGESARTTHRTPPARERDDSGDSGDSAERDR